MLKAKPKSSRQKQKAHGKTKNSRQKQKAQGKIKNSRQKQKAHGKSKSSRQKQKLTAKAKAHGKSKNTRGKSKSSRQNQNQRKGSWALILHAKAVGDKSNMAASSSLSSQMFCSNCGTEAVPTASICTRCGQGNRVKINK